MATNKTTRLEAINTMLSVIGEPPLNTLEGANRADALIAQAVLDEVSRDIQTEGWHFNSMSRVPYVADAEGKIVVPQNVVRLDLTEERYGYDVIVLDGYVYNKFSQSNVWPSGSTIYCSVVYLYEFDNLPQAARHYITIRAARIFGNRMVGDEKQHSFTAIDEMKALATLKEYEGETGDHTIFDHYSIGGIVDRSSIAPRVY